MFRKIRDISLIHEICVLPILCIELKVEGE
jgi:hypothetical protein